MQDAGWRWNCDRGHDPPIKTNNQAHKGHSGVFVPQRDNAEMRGVRKRCGPGERSQEHQEGGKREMWTYLETNPKVL